MSAVAERVERALTPIVTAQGYDLEGIEVQPAGRRRLLRVLVDHDDGVSLDAIAGLTSVLSAALDESGAMGEQPYVLEVSSPGVGRPLTHPRHWRRNVGRLAGVSTDDGRTLTARIVGSDDDTVTLRPIDEAGAKGQPDGEVPTVTVALTQITEAHVEVEF
jgi:ribosome maturation factor RimP